MATEKFVEYAVTCQESWSVTVMDTLLASFIMNYMKISAQDIYSKLPMIVVIVVSALDYSKLVPLACGKENSELTLLACGKKA